ncbi:MAG: hypothetical protein AB1349_11715 [Elusimicrobiota bacterium]
MTFLKDFPANKQIFIDSLVRNVYYRIGNLPSEIKDKVKNAFDTLDFRGKVISIVERFARKMNNKDAIMSDSIINEAVVPIIFSLRQVPTRYHLLIRDVCAHAVDKTFGDINNPPSVAKPIEPLVTVAPVTKYKPVAKPSLPYKPAAKPVVEAITTPKPTEVPEAPAINTKTLLISGGVIAALLIATQMGKKKEA